MGCIAHPAAGNKRLNQRSRITSTALFGLHISHAGVKQITHVQAIIGVGTAFAINLGISATGQPAQEGTQDVAAGWLWGLLVRLSCSSACQSFEQGTEQVTTGWLCGLMGWLSRSPASQSAQERTEQVATGWLCGLLLRRLGLPGADQGLE